MHHSASPVSFSEIASLFLPFDMLCHDTFALLDMRTEVLLFCAYEAAFPRAGRWLC